MHGRCRHWSCMDLKNTPKCVPNHGKTFKGETLCDYLTVNESFISMATPTHAAPSEYWCPPNSRKDLYPGSVRQYLDEWTEQSYKIMIQECTSNKQYTKKLSPHYWWHMVRGCSHNLEDINPTKWPISSTSWALIRNGCGYELNRFFVGSMTIMCQFKRVVRTQK